MRPVRDPDPPRGVHEPLLLPLPALPARPPRPVDLPPHAVRGGAAESTAGVVTAVFLGVTIAVLLFDVVVIGRRPHEPTNRETAGYLALYIGLAVAFLIFFLSTLG